MNIISGLSFISVMRWVQTNYQKSSSPGSSPGVRQCDGGGFGAVHTMPKMGSATVF